MSLFNRLFPMPPAELQLFLRRCGRPMIHLRNLVGSEAGPFSHVLRGILRHGASSHTSQMGSAGAWGFRQAILDLCRFFRGYDPADVLLRLRYETLPPALGMTKASNRWMPVSEFMFQLVM